MLPIVGNVVLATLETNLLQIQELRGGSVTKKLNAKQNALELN